MCYTTEPTYDIRTNGKTQLFSLALCSIEKFRVVLGIVTPPLRELRNISVLFRLKNISGLVENKDIILSCDEQLYMLVSETVPLSRLVTPVNRTFSCDYSCISW